MRVGIDARLAAWPGIGRYIRCLLDGLTRVESDIDFVVYAGSGEVESLAPGLDYRHIAFPPFSLREQWHWPRIARADGLDVLHTPHFNVPLRIRASTVVTIHDLAPLRFQAPGVGGTVRRMYARAFLRAAARYSTSVITDSTFIRHELCEHYHLHGHRLTTIPLALEPMFAVQSRIPKAESHAFQIHNKYILYVGTNKPWKNLEVALRGTQLAAAVLPNVHLVMAGKQAKHQEDLPTLVTRLGCGSYVTIVGVVDDRELARLYESATAVLCPSVYEGFGLTALEAMACGTPVIHSGAASLPEVVGETGLQADPYDPEEWRSAIVKLWNDPSLRDCMGAAGRERARQFTTDRMARETIAVYRALGTREFVKNRIITGRARRPL